jgi:hypothetical protein
MSTDNVNRDACATIQGYLYQFDATILSILDLQDNDSVTVEGIEDFDVFRKNISELFQCKYYEAARLTRSTMRDAILPMIKGFLRLNSKERATRRFHLYGYFKDSVPEEKTLSGDEIKKSLIRKKHTTRSGTSHLDVIDVQKEIGATDQDILHFSTQLTIHITEEYSGHKRKVIEALKKCCKTTLHEAEGFLYPSARTIISSIAAAKDPAARQLTKAAFISLITPSRALYNAWSLRELGEKTYCASLRTHYFSQRNIDAAHRIFVIDSALATTNAELLSICYALHRKWSSHRFRRKPDSERYVPFVFFRGLPADRLVAMKTLLQDEGVRFVDGYAFLGSTFSVEQLCIQQTYSNQLSLRIVTSAEDLASTVETIKGRRLIYDFFGDKPMNGSGNCTLISIPVTSVSMIDNII